MSYVLKTSSRSRNRFPVPLQIIIGLIIILSLLYLFAPKALPSFFTMIVRPFWNIEHTARYGDSFVDVAELIKENEELKRTLISNEGKYLQTDLLRKENEELKKLLGRENTANLILAQILKKPPLSAYDTLIVDTGSEEGIKEGNRVYALGSIPIGEIIEVTGKTSKVRLYSSAGEKYPVFIGSTSVETAALGKGGGAFEASVPRDTTIVPGDVVTIPSLNDAFLGIVQDIISEPSHPFATVLFSQPVNIYELRWVEIDIASSNETL